LQPSKRNNKSYCNELQAVRH